MNERVLSRFARPRHDERRFNIPTDPGALLDVNDVRHLLREHHVNAYRIMHAAGAFRLGRRLVIRRGDIDHYLESLVPEVAV